MLDTRYPFLSAYLKGEEAKLITSSHIDRMSKVSSLQDILEIIKETDIGGYLDTVLVETFDDLDEHLWLYLGGCFERLEWFKPVPSDMLKILKAYKVKYDVLNIKAALRGISSGKPIRRIPIGIIHNNRMLDEISAAESVDNITEVLTRCKLGDYASVLEKTKTDEDAKPGPLTETRLDELYYTNLVNTARGIADGATLSKVLGTIIDMKNLQVMLRAVIAGTGTGAAEHIIGNGYMLSAETIKELLPLKLSDIAGRLENIQYRNVVVEIVDNYDRTKNIAVVEEIVEKHKFRMSREILSPRVMSPLMIVWYLILEENEARNLRLIIKAMFDNIPVEEIRNYLVLPS